MTEDQEDLSNRSRGENHCKTNGHTPILALYHRFIPPNPQSPEEKKGQLRLSLLELTLGERSNGSKTLPNLCEQQLVPPLFPKQDLVGYEKVDSRVRPCGNCTDSCNSYCRAILLAAEEARIHGRNCDLITFQCTKRLYGGVENINGDNITITFYREKK